MDRVLLLDAVWEGIAALVSKIRVRQYYSRVYRAFGSSVYVFHQNSNDKRSSHLQESFVDQSIFGVNLFILPVYIISYLY